LYPAVRHGGDPRKDFDTGRHRDHHADDSKVSKNAHDPAPLCEEGFELLNLLPMQLQHSNEMRVQLCIKNIWNGLLDRLDQLSLISCSGCNRVLKAAFGAMFIGHPFARN
jgi:hypothetical protein